MHAPHPVHRRRRLLLALGVLACAAATPVLAPSLVQASGVAHIADAATGATGATDDPNNYTCHGHIERGAAEDGVTGLQVAYAFYCDGPITGYSIETEPHPIQYFDQSPLVTLATGVASATDAFSCNGFIPGVQINCVGSTAAGGDVISGQFTIAGKSLCTEPRLDPILTVTQATATATIGGTKAAPTATATVTQYLSGRYDLGRPWGCKGDGFGSNTRLGDNPPTVVLPGRPKK